MSMLHGGLLGLILGETPSTRYDIEQCQQQGLRDVFQSFDYDGLANQRLGCGLEPINWPKIIVNQCRALALTRPLTEVEQFTYDGALKALNNE